VANLIKSATGSWHMVFVITAIMNLLVVAMALFVLKPMRARIGARENAAAGAAALQPGE
jgi:OFA family oxalate/formate antiporter-like MFS transporter